MKRKIEGLTMEVTREYDNINHEWVYKYTFLNPTINHVVDYIMHYLLTDKGFNQVINKTDDIEDFKNGNFLCKGFLIAK